MRMKNQSRQANQRSWKFQKNSIPNSKWDINEMQQKGIKPGKQSG